MKIDRPTAADYARVDIDSARGALRAQQSRLQSAEVKLELAEFKLTCLLFVAEALEMETGTKAAVLVRATAETIRRISGASSVEAIKALGEAKV